ncbi:uncharacterized protein LOC116344288 [Contarinia nasturtii]|uniref:uncharacterized protein LOC116344288 n=1 Tax=Contarinia nasturtii TaxID=265458 RepID=UPI0012D3B64E|nr:uncharacterized protein LOC116344288 [Contarinia nasturtii]
MNFQLPIHLIYAQPGIPQQELAEITIQYMNPTFTEPPVDPILRNQYETDDPLYYPVHNSLTVLNYPDYQYQVNIQFANFDEIQSTLESHGINIKVIKLRFGNYSDSNKISLFMNLAWYHCKNVKELYLYSESTHDHLGLNNISTWFLVSQTLPFTKLEHLHLECLSDCVCGEIGYKDRILDLLLKSKHKNISKLTMRRFHLETKGFEIIATRLPSLKVLHYHGINGWDRDHGWFDQNVCDYDILATLKQLEELDIQDYRWFEAVRFIHGLAVNAPAIEKLTLKRLMGPYLEPEQDILNSIGYMQNIKSLKMSTFQQLDTIDFGAIAWRSDIRELEFDIVQPENHFTTRLLNILQEARPLRRITVNELDGFGEHPIDDSLRYSRFFNERKPSRLNGL